jgi:hypothetical protein
MIWEEDHAFIVLISTSNRKGRRKRNENKEEKNRSIPIS